MFALRRITSSGHFIPEVDGLRFVAIAMVVFYHLHGFVSAANDAGTEDSLALFARYGYRGVDLFYVVSGLILGLPFAAHYLKGGREVSLGAYYMRRLTRLEPPYILNMLLLFGVSVLVAGESASRLLPHLGASLLYAHSFLFGGQNEINPVTWTLEVEVQFYVVMPALARIYSVRSKVLRRTVLVAVILAAGLMQAFHLDAPPRIRLSLLYAIQFFLAGMLMADIFTVDWQQKRAVNWKWDCAALLLWPMLFLAPTASRVIAPLVIVALQVSVFLGPVSNRVFRNDALTTIGGMCYTIYLFHYPLIPGMLTYTRTWRLGTSVESYFVGQALLYLPLLSVICIIYFVLIERPCMVRDWPRKLMARVIR